MSYDRTNLTMRISILYAFSIRLHRSLLILPNITFKFIYQNWRIGTISRAFQYSNSKHFLTENLSIYCCSWLNHHGTKLIRCLSLYGIDTLHSRIFRIDSVWSLSRYGAALFSVVVAVISIFIDSSQVIGWIKPWVWSSNRRTASFQAVPRD